MGPSSVTTDKGGSRLEDSNGELGRVERWDRCNMMLTGGLHHARSCIAIQRFPEEHQSSAAHGFRFNRFLTTWKAVKRSNSF